MENALLLDHDRWLDGPYQREQDSQAAEPFGDDPGVENEGHECFHPLARMDDGICLDCGEDFNK